MSAGTVERSHGYARYKLDGCRCNVCGFAVSEYTRKRETAIRKGVWRIDAEVVRAHVRSLRAAGVGRRRIAELAGVHDSTVSRHLYGRGDRPAPSTMRHDLAQKILAVGPDLAPTAVVPAVGTVRRICGLVAIGWTLTEVAAGIGWSVSNLGTLLSRDSVTVRTAQAVAALYDRWSGTPSTGRSAGRSRRMAVARGWAPPLAWDDETIDNPVAVPYGVRAVAS